MDAQEVIAAIALTKIPGVGLLTAHALLKELGSAREVFANISLLAERVPAVSSRLTDALKNSSEAFRMAESEYAFAEKNRIHCLSYYDEAYPSRMRECSDAPLVLFCKGVANLNSLRMVSMVGTRRATPYGQELCEAFVRELAALSPEIVIVSGLAYGIDIFSHRAALANTLSTVGVLAHGLDRIYPHSHRQTAVEMLENGALLTEFPSGTNPDRQNFVQRNRIVAGICDATVVVESAAKGGSLITAELAQGYGRDCFAFPGRVGDENSAGCNRLIATDAAQLITSAKDFVEAMGWGGKAPKKAVQQELFIELTPEERHVTDILSSAGEMQINALVVAANLPVHRLSALLFELEMKGVVRALQGAVYKMR